MTKYVLPRRNMAAGLALLMLAIIVALLSDQSVIERQYIDVKLADGVISSVAVYLPKERPMGAALLLHGFSGTKENLALLACSLSKIGYVVFTPDWRGQGATGGRLTGQNETVISDIRAFSQALGSKYNLSFGVIGGHSMGGGFAQLAASELKPRFLIVICSGAMQNLLDSALADRTDTLFVVASLDTVVNPDRVLRSISIAINSSITPGSTYYSKSGSRLRAVTINGLDHLTVLYSQALSKEVLTFLDSIADPPFQEVIVAKLIAAVLWVIGLFVVTSDLSLSSQSNAKMQSTPHGTAIPILVSYAVAGLLYPLASGAVAMVPGLGMSFFTIGFFLSIVLVFGVAILLHLVPVKLDLPRLDVRALIFGSCIGLGYSGGLHLILGSDLIRLMPSVYEIPAFVLSSPIILLLAFLESSVLDSIRSRFPRWLTGIGTKAISLSFSLLIMYFLSQQFRGIFIIFIYSILLMLLPIYILESRLAGKGGAGRVASLAMFVIAISLLAAGSAVRL